MEGFLFIENHIKKKRNIKKKQKKKKQLGRKPLSEGFELWDRDYMLGALRLFQCKLEVAPPFEVAACLDAVGDILVGIEVRGVYINIFYLKK